MMMLLPLLRRARRLGKRLSGSGWIIRPLPCQARWLSEFRRWRTLTAQRSQKTSDDEARRNSAPTRKAKDRTRFGKCSSASTNTSPIRIARLKRRSIFGWSGWLLPRWRCRHSDRRRRIQHGSSNSPKIIKTPGVTHPPSPISYLASPVSHLASRVFRLPFALPHLLPSG